MKAEAGMYAGLAVGLAVLVACAGGVETAPMGGEAVMAGAAPVAPAAAPRGF